MTDLRVVARLVRQHGDRYTRPHAVCSSRSLNGPEKPLQRNFLHGANLSGANLAHANLSDVVGWSTVTLEGVRGCNIGTEPRPLLPGC